MESKLNANYLANEAYQNEFRRQKGKLLGLETPFLLLHVLSNKFLCCSETDSTGFLDVESMNLCLDEEIFENSIFTIRAPFRTQMDSQQYARVNQPLFLSTHFLSQYVEVTKPDPRGIIKFVYTSKPRCKLEFQIVQATTFSNPEVQEQNVCYSDVVWIHHAELELDLAYTPQKKEVPYQESTEQIEKETKERIQYTKINKKIIAEASSNGMWILENETPVTGEVFCFDAPFRLKHFRTGRYLTFKQMAQISQANLGKPERKESGSMINITLLSQKYEVSLERKPSANSSFVCSMRKDSFTKKKGKVQVMVESLVQIKHIASEAWLSLSKVTSIFNQADSNSHEKITVDDILFPTLSQKLSYEDIFKFYKASSSQIWETSFLMYTIPQLYNWERVLKDWDIESLVSVPMDSLASIKDALINMILFCCQGDDESTHSSLFPSKYGMKTNIRRQKFFSEQYAIETLLAMIAGVFDSEEKLMACLNSRDEFENMKNRKEKKKSIPMSNQLMIDPVLIKMEKCSVVIDILKCSYELLTMIVHENSENKKKCTDHLSSFVKHIGFDVGSIECFSTIVENNEQLLNKLRECTIGEKSLIEYLIMLLASKRPHQTEVMQVLDVVSRCNKMGITANQSFINNKIFPEIYQKSPNLIRFAKEELNPMKVEIQIEDKVVEKRLTELHSNEAQLLFFQVSLFASLSFDRNYSCRDNIVEILTFESLSENMCNSDVPDSLASVFCKLISDCHIDCKPLRKVNIKKFLLPFVSSKDLGSGQLKVRSKTSQMKSNYSEMLTISAHDRGSFELDDEPYEKVQRRNTEVKLKNGTFTKTITQDEIESLQIKIESLLVSIAEDEFSNLHFTPFILSLIQLIYRLFKFNLYIADSSSRTILKSLFAFLALPKSTMLQSASLRVVSGEKPLGARSKMAKNLTTLSEQKKDSIISKTTIEMFNQRLLRNCIYHTIEFQNKKRSNNNLSLSDLSLEVVFL